MRAGTRGQVSIPSLLQPLAPPPSVLNSSGKYWPLCVVYASELGSAVRTHEGGSSGVQALSRDEEHRMNVWPLWLAGLVILPPTHLHNLLCELGDVISPISVSSFLVKDKEL